MIIKMDKIKAKQVLNELKDYLEYDSNESFKHTEKTVAEALKTILNQNRVYISGKITGLTENEALQLFNDAETELKNKGFEVVNPMTIPHEHGKTWVEYMREDLKALLTCDTIFMLENWQQSKGATIERNLALTLDFNIIYQ